MIYRFPYTWAGEIDTKLVAPCCVRGPAASEPEALDGQLRHAPLATGVRTALEAPVGAPPLGSMLHQVGARRILILADDITRPTPQRELMPILIEYLLSAGIRAEDLTVLIATGLHRPMRPNEIEDRFGRLGSDRIRVLNHDACDRTRLVQFGTARDGTPILVNGLVKEHDFILSVGAIAPHRIAGFSGGGKMVQPGICGEQITASIHWRGWQAEGETIYGVIENAIRREIESVAAAAGLRFILNVVLDASGKIRRCFAGDPLAAFRAGCKESRRVAVVPTHPADIVVVDSHPFDLDFWQACKAISVAELVVRRGGTIILVTPCPEGLSSHSGEIRKTGYLPKSEIEERVRSGSISNLAIACHLMAVGRILERGQLLIVSPGLTADLLEQVGLGWAPDAMAAIETARRRLGAGADICLLSGGCSLIPELRAGGRINDH